MRFRAPRSPLVDGLSDLDAERLRSYLDAAQRGFPKSPPPSRPDPGMTEQRPKTKRRKGVRA